ncbi:MAG: restriction endonuclease subunit S, partial [Phycisphaerae bacterium]
MSDTDYAYYLTKWEGVCGYAISQMTGTSGRQRVPTAALDNLKIQLPPLPEQRAIAHILGTLDDKIELNRRQNETLEAMARTLFKAWFVDFEPVRAKLEGRWQRGQTLPGLPAHLYDLFPDRLVESELGEIPEGWEVGRIADLAEVMSGRRPVARFSSPCGEARVPLWGGNG